MEIAAIAFEAVIKAFRQEVIEAPLLKESYSEYRGNKLSPTKRKMPSYASIACSSDRQNKYLSMRKELNSRIVRVVRHSQLVAIKASQENVVKLEQ